MKSRDNSVYYSALPLFGYYKKRTDKENSKHVLNAKRDKVNGITGGILQNNRTTILI